MKKLTQMDKSWDVFGFRESLADLAEEAKPYYSVIFNYNVDTFAITGCFRHEAEDIIIRIENNCIERINYRLLGDIYDR